MQWRESVIPSDVDVGPKFDEQLHNGQMVVPGSVVKAGYLVLVQHVDQLGDLGRPLLRKDLVHPRVVALSRKLQWRMFQIILSFRSWTYLVEGLVQDFL